MFTEEEKKQMQTLIDAGDEAYPEQWYNQIDDRDIIIQFGRRSGGVRLHPDTPQGAGNARFIVEAANSRAALKAAINRLNYLEDIIDSGLAHLESGWSYLEQCKFRSGDLQCAKPAIEEALYALREAKGKTDG